MLDPQLWTLGETGLPIAVFPRSFAAMSAGEAGVLLIEYAETAATVGTGPYKTIQLYVNPQLAEHFHKYIDATIGA